MRSIKDTVSWSAKAETDVVVRLPVGGASPAALRTGGLAMQCSRIRRLRLDTAEAPLRMTGRKAIVLMQHLLCSVALLRVLASSP